MTEIPADPALADALRAMQALRTQRDYARKTLRNHEDMLRAWAVKCVLFFHMSIARAASEAGVHRRTMQHWVDVARAEQGRQARQR